MDKNPREMSCEELLIKLEEDGVNAKAVRTIRGEIVYLQEFSRIEHVGRYYSYSMFTFSYVL